MSDRENYVLLNGVKSRVSLSNIGLPQGSIISPILFLTYINDIPNVSNHLECTLFADDTIFSYAHSNFDLLVSTVNSELIKISKWLHSNRLTLNVPKTEILLNSNRSNACKDKQIILS